MYRRFLILFLHLMGLAPVSPGADAVSIKIRQIGLENYYALGNSPTLISADVRNTTMQTVPIALLVDEVDLEYDARSVTTSLTLPFVLSPGEERTIRVPLRIIPGENRRFVIYLEARNANGLPVGRTGRLVPQKVQGQLIALICSTAELCRGIQQSILFTGSPEEQTHKSQSLRMAQLAEPPSEGWAYSPASMVILAAPLSRLSDAQREALELFLRNSGKLILIEDQLGDGLSSSPQTSPAAKTASFSTLAAPNRNIRFLEPYRNRLPFGKTLPVGSGELVRLPSASGKLSSDYFRPIGFSSNTPQLLVRQFTQIDSKLQWVNTDQSAWLMRRLGTTFRFPSFLEILCWLLGYLLLVGFVNFVILRAMGKPEWAWFTIPAIAILASLMLYISSARNRPRNFGLDDMVIYRMDSLSPLATAQARIRISSPARSIVEPLVSADWVYEEPAHGFGDFLDGPSFTGPRSYANVREILLEKSWQTRLSLRKWSFTELEFTGRHRFAGTIYRDSAGRLHNGTGISFQQAIVADHKNVFVLGRFPADAVADQTQVLWHTYQEETGRVVNFFPAYPGPPFQIRKPENQQHPNFTDAEIKRMNEEWESLTKQPFALSELLRGWPGNGDDVFYETKAVFFGLSDQATLGPSLRGKTPDRKSASLTIVKFGEWP